MTMLGLARFQAVCLDAADVRQVADFWATLLGHEVRMHDEGYASLSGGDGPDFWVNPVPAATRVKNRVHVDVQLAGPDTSALVALGASVLREPGSERQWWVLADPEGNEFCAFPSEPAARFDNDADAEATT